MATQYLEAQQVPAIKEIKDSVDVAKASAETAATKAAEAAAIADEAVSTAAQAVATAEAATEATATATETLNENITKIDDAVTAANEAKAEVESRLDIKGIDETTLNLDETGKLSVIGGGGGDVTDIERVVLSGVSKIADAGHVYGVMQYDQDYETRESHVAQFTVSEVIVTPVAGDVYRIPLNFCEHCTNGEWLGEVMQGKEFVYNGGDPKDINSYTYANIPVDQNGPTDMSFTCKLEKVSGDGTAEITLDVWLHSDNGPIGEWKYPHERIAKIDSKDPLKVRFSTYNAPTADVVVDANMYDAVFDERAEKTYAINSNKQWVEAIDAIDANSLSAILAPYSVNEREIFDSSYGTGTLPDLDSQVGSQTSPYANFEKVIEHVQKNAKTIKTFGNAVTLYSANVDDFGGGDRPLEQYGSLLATKSVTSSDKNSDQYYTAKINVNQFVVKPDDLTSGFHIDVPNAYVCRSGLVNEEQFTGPYLELNFAGNDRLKSVDFSTSIHGLSLYNISTAANVSAYLASDASFSLSESPNVYSEGGIRANTFYLQTPIKIIPASQNPSSTPSTIRALYDGSTIVLHNGTDTRDFADIINIEKLYSVNSNPITLQLYKNWSNSDTYERDTTINIAEADAPFTFDMSYKMSYSSPTYWSQRTLTINNNSGKAMIVRVPKLIDDSVTINVNNGTKQVY